jgi:predicted phosphodiesterase
VKLGVLSDVHANLPALEAGLRLLESEQCDVVVHTGDAIGIGPHPAECLDLLLRCGAELVMGNHDAYFAFGLDDWPYSAEELAHQRWVHDQLDPVLRPIVAAWPFKITRLVGRHTLLFTHYGRAADGSFTPPGRDTTVSDLDAMFQSSAVDVVFFGHDHDALDAVGTRCYVNPGSVGCHTRAEARAAIVEVRDDDDIRIRRVSVPYDDSSVFADLEGRHVPDREFIRSTFLFRD